MSKNKHSVQVPKKMQPYYEAITNLTDLFSQKYLNDDYQLLARYTTAALCRKRASPLLTGKSNIWACAILYSLGKLNFLFDKNNKPYFRVSDLAAEFNLSKNSVRNKAEEVQAILNMRRFTHRWCLTCMLKDNYLAWMIAFNGIAVDSRELPKNYQEVAYKKGLIPYVYADLIDNSEESLDPNKHKKTM